MTVLHDFANNFPGIAGSIASVAWCMGSRKSVSKKDVDLKRVDGAIAQICMAIMLALIGGGLAVYRGDWAGLLLVGGVLWWEVRLIREILTIQDRIVRELK